MSDSIPPGSWPQRHPPLPPQPTGGSNKAAVAALVLGILAALATLTNAGAPIHSDTSLGYELGFRGAPLLLACAALAFGKFGLDRARSTGRGRGPAITALVLGSGAAGISVLQMLAAIAYFA